MVGESACQILDANIIGDVPVEFTCLQTKRAIFGRNIAACVVGGQEQAEAEITVDTVHRRE